jgi:hypothetical protein
MKSPLSNDWKGYTLDELAYMRAMTLARREIERHRLGMEFDRARQGNVMLSKGLFSKMVSLVSFTDMIVIGVKLWRSISPLFSRKKR